MKGDFSGTGFEHQGVRTHPTREDDAIAASEDVVHPDRLPVARCDEVCDRCYGALVPRPEAWDRVAHRVPFVPGRSSRWRRRRYGGRS